jgi:hypothetical protein
MTKNKHPRTSWRIRPLLASVAIAAGVGTLSLSGPTYAAEFTVYKSPWCGCCSKWVDYLQASGHTVSTKDIENLDMVKKMAGVPEHLQSCHTAMVDGYVIEGHVPSKDIERLLAERPKAKGLAVPGMPAGSPGMEGGAPDKYDVMLFNPDGSSDVFARY